jgi:thiol-disulfide isomerase/thioredoxin
MRLVGVCAAVLVVAFVGPSAAFELTRGGTLDSRVIALIEPPVPAPDTVIELEDGQISLPEYRGQVALVTLWATWCHVCQYEMPILDALGREYKGRGLVIVPLSVDQAPAMEKVVTYLTSRKIDLPAMLDRNFALAGKVGLRGTPTTIVVDKFSQVVAAFEGQAPWEDAETRAWLDALIAAETPAASRGLLGG